MSTSALWELSGTAIAARVRRGDVRAVDVVDAHLARIAEINPSVNAVTQLFADRARSEAAELDRRRDAGELLGPLAGVPFTVKESLAVEGTATTHGIARFRALLAAADAPPVARLREAGAIPIGHTNMPDLTLGGMHSRSELFGDTVNPWSRAHTPGGSSGGDGAAIATGMAPLGLGTDAGGSVRIPASFCGVAALKSSYGRFAADHRIGSDEPTLASQLLPVDGPIARTVADLRAAYEALGGPDLRDPRALPMPLRGAPLAAPPTVAVVFDPGGAGVHPEVREALERAASALSASGYEVVEQPDVPRMNEALASYRTLVMTEFALMWPVVKTIVPERSHPFIEMSMAGAVTGDLAEYVRASSLRLAVQRAWARFFSDFPLVLGPVFTEPPVAPGIESSSVKGHARVTSAMRLCTASSLVGAPAVAVPVGVFGGLPCAVQLIGAMYREDLCLDAAEAIENRVGLLTPIDPR